MSGCDWQTLPDHASWWTTIIPADFDSIERRLGASALVSCASFSDHPVRRMSETTSQGLVPARAIADEKVCWIVFRDGMRAGDTGRPPRGQPIPSAASLSSGNMSSSIFRARAAGIFQARQGEGYPAEGRHPVARLVPSQICNEILQVWLIL